MSRRRLKESARRYDKKQRDLDPDHAPAADSDLQTPPRTTQLQPATPTTANLQITASSGGRLHSNFTLYPSAGILPTNPPLLTGPYLLLKTTPSLRCVGGTTYSYTYKPTVIKQLQPYS